MKDRERRLAENEALFREVNERVSDVNEEWASQGVGTEPFGIVCECARERCADTIELTRAEYEAVRAHGARFAVRPGHDVGDVEIVIERRADYWIVEKTGGSRPYVERLDPRARSRA